MTDTVISSATKEHIIGDDRPFTIIGERINPTGRKVLAEEMKAGDFSRVEADALAQVAAGAQMLDVNAGIPLADEPALLAKAVQMVQALTDAPLSIDSSIIEALEAGLGVYQGKALVNSVTGEDEVLERVLPLVAKYGAAVVAISNDETVMPIGAMRYAGRQVFDILGRIRNELKCNTTCGASNISFGLPQRNGINGAFLSMSISAGMTSAITNPIHEEVMRSVMAADVLMGNDQDCLHWIKKYREPAAEGSEGARGRRPTRRRRKPE